MSILVYLQTKEGRGGGGSKGRTLSSAGHPTNDESNKTMQHFVRGFTGPLWLHGWAAQHAHGPNMDYNSDKALHCAPMHTPQVETLSVWVVVWNYMMM
jgi:hypothetical protein